jgi:hypothetical protein
MKASSSGLLRSHAHKGLCRSHQGAHSALHLNLPNPKPPPRGSALHLLPLCGDKEWSGRDQTFKEGVRSSSHVRVRDPGPPHEGRRRIHKARGPTVLLAPAILSECTTGSRSGVELDEQRGEAGPGLPFKLLERSDLSIHLLCPGRQFHRPLHLPPVRWCTARQTEKDPKVRAVCLATAPESGSRQQSVAGWLGGRLLRQKNRYSAEARSTSVFPETAFSAWNTRALPQNLPMLWRANDKTRLLACTPRLGNGCLHHSTPAMHVLCYVAVTVAQYRPTMSLSFCSRAPSSVSACVPPWNTIKCGSVETPNRSATCVQSTSHNPSRLDGLTDALALLVKVATPAARSPIVTYQSLSIGSG